MGVLQRWLASGWLLAAAAVLAVALSAPSLSGGLQTEDHMHADAIRRGVVELPWKVNLFAYNSGEAYEIYRQKDFGTIPWLAVENYKISFWRPVASLTHHFDYRVLREPWAMHAHSLGWLVGLLASVFWLYRRLEDRSAGWIAGLALLLYAVDDAHGHAIGWIANRNALMAATFGTLAVVFHDRWRRQGGLGAAAASSGLFALALLSAELGVGTLAYLVAYAVFLESGTPRSTRVASVLPAFAVVAGWFATYTALGHGTYGSGLYTSPWVEPVAYLREAAWRMPAMLSGLFAVPTADEWNGLTEQHRWMGVGVVLALVGAVVWASRSRNRDQTSRFWALGTLLALVPLTATFPSDRNLFFGGLGAMALIARFVADAFRTRRPLGLALSVGLLAVHLPLAGWRLPQRVQTMDFVGTMNEHAAATALDGQRPGQTLVLVRAPSFYLGGLIIGVAVSRERDVPQHTRVLYGGRGELQVHRPHPQVLELTAPDGFLSDPIDRVYRGAAHPMEAGQGLYLSGMLAYVRAVTADGAPRTVRFEFVDVLEHRRLRFVSWDGTAYVPFRLPEVGGRAVLPPTP